MSESEAQVRRWFEVLHSRDFETLAGLYAPDATYVRVDGTSKGADEIVTYLRGILGAFPDHASRLDAVLPASDAVTVEWTETGTHTQPYASPLGRELAPTGRSFEVPIVEVFRFQGDKIISQHEYYDLLSLLAQVGWLEGFVAAMYPPSTSAAQS